MSVQISVDGESLRPVVAAVVAEVLAQLDADRAQLGDRLAYNEADAAKLLGVGPHVLRDERLRGRIAASSIVGRRVRYTRADLEAYLRQRRNGASPPPRG
jgi:hypothetical protein